ncbi:hypothetical protein MGEO_20135 [Marivita geojedonensis]|uniref:Uncharacterized protein n=1 Tax=Marivita geojedonensis TaxID=1123756 RepID=A0A1X4N9D1_9RHOB|nr:hypothetical protein MGEO_20135 [Marivita geojedonensis]
MVRRLRIGLCSPGWRRTLLSCPKSSRICQLVISSTARKTPVIRTPNCWPRPNHSRAVPNSRGHAFSALIYVKRWSCPHKTSISATTLDQQKRKKNRYWACPRSPICRSPATVLRLQKLQNKKTNQTTCSGGSFRQLKGIGRETAMRRPLRTPFRFPCVRVRSFCRPSPRR